MRIMWKRFKTAFWVPYEDSATYPTVEIAQLAIAKYCEENGATYAFPDVDTVVIDGKEHEIYRGLSFFNRGNYIIKCREK